MTLTIATAIEALTDLIRQGHPPDSPLVLTEFHRFARVTSIKAVPTHRMKGGGPVCIPGPAEDRTNPILEPCTAILLEATR